MSEEQRTAQQNKALHKWCEQLAVVLNEAGLDQRRVLKEEIAIPWNKDAIKEAMFKPLLEAMTKHESTADAGTKDYNKVYELLARHLADKLGVVAPAWPTRFGEDER